MKRLQISIEEELDEALAVEATRLEISRAELIRRYVRDRLQPSTADALDVLVGDIDADAGDIDAVIYG